MTDQELLDMFIQERINMLIDVFHKTNLINLNRKKKGFYRLRFLLKICQTKRRNWLKITLTPL